MLPLFKKQHQKQQRNASLFVQGKYDLENTPQKYAFVFIYTLYANKVYELNEFPFFFYFF